VVHLPIISRFETLNISQLAPTPTLLLDPLPPTEDPWQDLDRVHYTGAIAHEVAHAVMQHNLKTVLISPSPQEYLAHATQMAALPEARRKAIIRAMGVDSWQSGDVISDVYLGLEPDKFAVKSYLHLSGLVDPRAFVEILLNAKWFYVSVP
jgi:hypothetical protein